MESIPDNNTPILVVDDYVSLLFSIKVAIVKSGMLEPALVSDCRRVLELVRQYRFQLVLLDIIMPHIHGIDLLKQLKQEFPEVECVMITAVDKVSSAVEAMQFGAYDYLTKSFDSEKLIVTINRALEMIEQTVRLRH